MKCQRCNSEMIQNCCVKCGYLDNGIYVKTDIETKSKYEDLKLYNKNFDKMYRNKNYLLPLILGTTYLSYTGHIILGSILGIIEFLLFLYVATISSILSLSLTYLMLFIYIFIVRMLCATLLNSFSLKLDELKINRIKKKYANNYKIYLTNHNNKGFLLLVLNIIIYILFIIIFYILKSVVII